MSFSIDARKRILLLIDSRFFEVSGLARGDRAERIRRHTGTTFAEVFAAGPLVVFRVSGRPGS